MGHAGWGTSVTSYHALPAGSITSSRSLLVSKHSAGVRLTRALALALPPMPSEAGVTFKAFQHVVQIVQFSYSIALCSTHIGDRSYAATLAPM